MGFLKSTPGPHLMLDVHQTGLWPCFLWTLGESERRG